MGTVLVWGYKKLQVFIIAIILNLRKLSARENLVFYSSMQWSILCTLQDPWSQWTTTLASWRWYAIILTATWRQLCTRNSCEICLVSMLTSASQWTNSFRTSSDRSGTRSTIIITVISLIFRSTPKSQPNNMGLMSVRRTVRPSVHKKFFRFRWNLVCS